MSIQDIKDKWYNSDLYKWNPDSELERFSIDTPPPTVSGSLHMGHVFSYTQTDFIARYKRMRGYNVFYPIGFDDNGLPTERLAEKIYNVRGIQMVKDGKKEEFSQMCKNVIKESEEEFEKLFKALGLSFDWSQKYQTISDKSKNIAIESYNDLCKKGLVYKANRPVYWCPVDQTALAQADIEDKEKDSQEITFRCDFHTISIDIMTTRPELIPACVMVLYNPKDDRVENIKAYIKSQYCEEQFTDYLVTMPFGNRRVRLVPDENVQTDKGTGFVMCCSYGDWQDVEWIRRHKMESTVNQIITKDGKINKKEYGGNDELIKVTEARKLAIELLGNKVISNKPIKHTVKCAERSGTPIEIIETEQYYIDFGLSGYEKQCYIGEECSRYSKINQSYFKNCLLILLEEIEFKPEHLKKRLIDWINGLNQDWCISRDRFSGIQIPNTNKVFDTWFTSSLSPQLNTGALKFEENEKHDKLFPMDLRPQAHEIIRTWAFYTMVKAFFHGCKKIVVEKQNCVHGFFDHDTHTGFVSQNYKNLIPWKTIALSGWCLASDKTKMSKSKGNIITPMPLIEEKGADVVRYWASCSHLGVDTHFNETKFRDGQRLIAKLKSVAKFILPYKQNINDFSVITELSDKWIIAEFFNLYERSTSAFENYDYCTAREVVERFFWNLFCDNYLEIIKGRIYGKNGYAYKYDEFKTDLEIITKFQKSAVITVLLILRNILLLLAPIIPFTTEEIWQEMSFSDESLHKAGSLSLMPLPTLPTEEKTAVLKTSQYMLDIIDKVRKYKADKQLSIKAPVKKLYLPELPEQIKLDLLSVINAFEAEIIINKDFMIEC